VTAARWQLGWVVSACASTHNREQLDSFSRLREGEAQSMANLYCFFPMRLADLSWACQPSLGRLVRVGSTPVFLSPDNQHNSLETRFSCFPNCCLVIVVWVACCRARQWRFEMLWQARRFAADTPGRSLCTASRPIITHAAFIQASLRGGTAGHGALPGASSFVDGSHARFRGRRAQSLFVPSYFCGYVGASICATAIRVAAGSHVLR
jgi:hypothetical protein